MATKKRTTRSDAPDPDPAFVFRGTVKKIGSATMKEVPVSDRTAVVHVDQVIESPKSFVHYEGQNITVQLEGRKKVAAGDELIFHTHSWIFGESVAVRAVTLEKVTKAHAALLQAVGDPTAQRASRLLAEHVNAADLVVSGKVMAVTVPPEVTGHALAEAHAMGAAAPPAVFPVSEHDPKWRQAIIQVDDTQKGNPDSSQVTVLFPASTDVLWYKAPKFQAGQKGTFILHKTKIETQDHHALRGLAAVAGGGTEVEVYTALHPEDVLPLQQQAAIKAMIR
jgi:hypothetical protein